MSLRRLVVPTVRWAIGQRVSDGLGTDLVGDRAAVDAVQTQPIGSNEGKGRSMALYLRSMLPWQHSRPCHVSFSHCQKVLAVDRCRICSSKMSASLGPARGTSTVGPPSVKQYLPEILLKAAERESGPWASLQAPARSPTTISIVPSKTFGRVFDDDLDGPGKIPADADGTGLLTIDQDNKLELS